MDHHVVVRGGQGVGLVAKRRDKGHRFDPQRKELIFSLNYSSDLKMKISLH